MPPPILKGPGLRIGVGCAVILTAAGNAPLIGQQSPRIPLQAGLTIVKAVANPKADYETIIQVTTIDSEAVRLKVTFPPRSQRTDETRKAAADSGGLELLNAVRVVRRVDLQSARHYMLQWNTRHPELFPGTTAIGASSAILDALKRRGASTFHLGIPSTGSTDSNLRYFEDLGRRSFLIRRVEPEPVSLPVIVNDMRVMLPAIHARGRVQGVQADFWFLDDLSNPIALKWQIGKQHLQVTAISFPMAEQKTRIAASLKASGRVELYGIYFDVGSAVIKPESEPVLREIAAALSANTAWKISIAGHTDSVGGAHYNLELSRARAQAVRDALVASHGIAPARLTTVGYGLTRPRESNNTLEGRALNRRVELVLRERP